MTTYADSHERATVDLLGRARAGDDAAFASLVKPLCATLRRLLRRLAGTPSDVDDLVQETLIRAWRGLPGYRSDARFSTWLYAIAANESRRGHSRRPPAEHVPYDADLHDAPGAGPAPLDAALAADARAALLAAIATLPPRYREAVVLADVRGLPNDAAAAVAGVSVRAFKSRLHRGRSAIRAELEHDAAAAPGSRDRLLP